MSNSSFHALIDVLKQKVTLSDFVKNAVSWDKKKSSVARQDWWSPCPFHSEKSASFHVDDRKGFYHCFGCGVHGTVIDWLMNYQRMNFIEALKHLCQITNTPMPEYSKEKSEQTEKKKSLYDLMQQTQNYYAQELFSPKNRNALDYVIHKRGLTPENIKKYGIGYASHNRTGLFDFLIKQGYSQADCLESGMVIIPEEEGSKPYDRFRDRIMFPVCNPQGNIVTFGGRALSADAKAKYLNGSETDIFKKSFVLYNLDKALKRDNKTASFTNLLVCEGYMDVITLGCYGFNHAVAPMGTALALEQIKLLWRYSPEPILCFDGDKAGLTAACRAAHKVLEILEAGFSLNFCFLPDNLDPDDYLKQHGKQAFKTLIDNPVPLSAVLFANAVENTPPTSPEKRAKLEKELFAITNHIPDERLRKLYQSDFFSRLGQFFAKKPNSNPYKQNVYSFNNNPRHTQNTYGNRQYYTESNAVNDFKKQQKKSATDSLEHIEKMILGFFIRYGYVLEKRDFDVFSNFSFNNDEKKYLQREILNVFIKFHIKKLEIHTNVPIMPSDKSDSYIENLWQFSDTIRQSDIYRQALRATESIKMSLDLPFINHNDRINYNSEIFRYGLCDMYKKILSEQETNSFLNKMSVMDNLEEEYLERFLLMKKTSIE